MATGVSTKQILDQIISNAVINIERQSKIVWFPPPVNEDSAEWR
jgi:hypothetical protein